MLYFHMFREIPSHFDTCKMTFFFTHQWKVIHRVYNNSLVLWCVFCYPPKAWLQNMIPIEKRLLSCWFHPNFILKMKNITIFIPIHTFQCIKTIFTINTMEPCLMATFGNTVTSLLWPLFHRWENGHRFLYKKKKHLLMATFTVPNRRILYNFIPLN